MKAQLLALVVKVEGYYLSAIAKIKSFMPKFTALWTGIKAYFARFTFSHWRLAIEIALITILSLFLMHELHKITASKPTPAISEIATPAPIVQSEPIINAPIKSKTVQVYKNSKSIKAAVKLPDVVVKNDSEKVITSSQLGGVQDNPQTVTTVLNLDTGISTTFVKSEPLPWIATDKRGEVGLYAGIKNGSTAIRLQAEQNIIDIKSIHLKAIGSIDQLATGKTDYFVGAGGAFAW